MEQKEKYKILCENNSIPLFAQYYWLDSICENNWDVIIIEENGEILGTMPYMITYENGEKIVQKISLTQNNGIYFFYREKLKQSDKKMSFEIKVTDLIIDEIEKLGLKKYRQYFHYNFTNWLPFYWRGYSQTTRYTYIIDKEITRDEVWSNFNGNIRTSINKAKKILNVKEKIECEEFYKLVEKTYLRQNLNTPFELKTLRRIYKNLSSHNALKTLYAIDEKNNIHAAALFGIDSESVYYLMSGSDEKFRDSQALTLLIYEGILYAKSVNKKFDFEGSMKKNIEVSFRRFGAIQKPYFDISKNF